MIVHYTYEGIRMMRFGRFLMYIYESLFFERNITFLVLK